MHINEIPSTCPVVAFEGELGERLFRALREAPMSEDKDVEDLLWEAEVCFALGDRDTTVAALELVGF
jgi:hypothetical protein